MANSAGKIKMQFLHNHEDFKYFVQEVSRRIGLETFIIEKDYWVTYILKKLAKSEFSDEIVFKGGTCLSKAYNLIERFSEDVDLLMLERENTQSKTQKEKRLIAIREFVNSLDNLSYTTGNRSQLYAAFKYEFPSLTQAIGVVTKEILIEPGYRGGIMPKVERKFITSFVENALHNKLDSYDIEPFEINVLALERIFMEKLFALKEIYEKDNGKTLATKTRHYYDIYKLLETEEIQALLKNQNEINSIIDDINLIGKEHFALESVTWEELKNHISIKSDAALTEILQKGYLNDKALYKIQPNFKEIIEKINELVD